MPDIQTPEMRSKAYVRRFTRPLCDGAIVEEPLLGGARAGAPANFSRSVIDVGASLPLHAHEEVEVWIVTRGHGDLSYDGVEARVGVGDVLYFTPGVAHQLVNRADEPFELVSIYWK